MSVKAQLMESRKTMKNVHKIDLTSMTDFKNMVVNDQKFDTYKATLMESVSAEHKLILDPMVQRTRMKLMESINSVYNLNVYETLALPILFAYYPRLITKELVTMRPINAPDTLMPFMNFNFVDAKGNVIGQAPFTAGTVSYGPTVFQTDNKFVPVGSTDILAAHALTTDETSIERTMKFFKMEATKGGVTEQVSAHIIPTVDGNFFHTATFPTIGALSVSGRVNYKSGVVEVMQSDATFTAVKLFYTCSFSLEQNILNNTIKPSIDKIRLLVEDQEISADWTIQMEQDYNALYDLDIQSQIIEILGKQMALDVDTKVLKNMFDVIANLPASHIDTFDKTPPSGYTLGPIYWYQNILEKLTMLSARIYTDTNIGEGNVMACNPIDAAIFESLNKFSFDGKGADGGALGYSTGSLAQRWKVFSSPIVPQGKMMLLHKPTDILSAIYVFAPYQPAVMSPYPLGNTPSLTVLSRNAQLFYRPMGAALLNIVQS